MQKFTPPPALTDELVIENILRQLYRRRLVVGRLIRSLELYARISSRHKAFVPMVSERRSSHHVN